MRRAAINPHLLLGGLLRGRGLSLATARGRAASDLRLAWLGGLDTRERALLHHQLFLLRLLLLLPSTFSGIDHLLMRLYVVQMIIMLLGL